MSKRMFRVTFILPDPYSVEDILDMTRFSNSREWKIVNGEVSLYFEGRIPETLLARAPSFGWVYKDQAEYIEGEKGVNRIS